MITVDVLCSVSFSYQATHALIILMDLYRCNPTKNHTIEVLSLQPMKQRERERNQRNSIIFAVLIFFLLLLLIFLLLTTKMETDRHFDEIIGFDF